MPFFFLSLTIRLPVSFVPVFSSLRALCLCVSIPSFSSTRHCHSLLAKRLNPE
jgi:hypothetical protein